MHADHALLLAELRRGGRPMKSHGVSNDSYGSSGRPFYNVSVPARRIIARRWLRAEARAPAEKVLAVVGSLVAGQSHEEKTLAAFLLVGSAPARRAAPPVLVDGWLDHVNGWAEVDCLCANVFTAEDLAADWPAWRAFIAKLARDDNINKRRAALVLLTGPLRYVDDPRFSELALSIIEQLKGERAILITKAVSWLLRSMVLRNRAAVEAYLATARQSLPAIALRETRTKLATGTKSDRSAADRRARAAGT